MQNTHSQHISAPAAMLQLPHTAQCLVCGRDNPHGLKLDLFVDPQTGVVTADFIPAPHHVGFEGIIHGGLLATVLDEAMTWAATWWGKRFCVCGEMTIRLRQGVAVGQNLRVEAIADRARPKLIEPTAKLFDEYHKLLATASGKYVPIAADRHERFIRSFVEDARTAQSAAMLRGR